MEGEVLGRQLGKDLGKVLDIRILKRPRRIPSRRKAGSV